MKRYRFDFRDRGEVIHSSAVNYPDDDGALGLAQRLAQYHPVDVWCDQRFVAHVQKNDVREKVEMEF